MPQTGTANTSSALWPELPYEAWEDTLIALHMRTQIVGKAKLKLTPFWNEWWEVALVVTARGLSTLTIPYQSRTFQISFDFIDHELHITVDDGRYAVIPLVPQSVADFYRTFMEVLESLGIRVAINTTPVETDNTIPFEKDTIHASYDPQYTNRFWRVLVQTEKIFQVYRSSFFGKNSPIHFFWGSFDLAHTRFSGRPAPEQKGASRMMRLAMDQEQIAVGFWPGDNRFKAPAFYAYIFPQPDGYKTATIKPNAAFYNQDLNEFLLPYADVRSEAVPEKAILDFLQSTYEAGATLAKWNRSLLEKKVA